MLPLAQECIDFFFFNDTATTEIYTLSLHDALPIWGHRRDGHRDRDRRQLGQRQLDRHQLRHEHHDERGQRRPGGPRSEEHTSELQSRQYLVCRLLLEKKITSTNPFIRSGRLYLVSF